MRSSLALAVSLLSSLSTAAPDQSPSTVGSVLGSLGNLEPPPLIYTPHPSPECAKPKGGNGGALQCCRAIVAGDLPVVQFLAAVYGYELNKNDVNGVLCDDDIDQCPGVRLCCEVTALNPLVSLYCADYNPH